MGNCCSPKSDSGDIQLPAKQVLRKDRNEKFVNDPDSPNNDKTIYDKIFAKRFTGEGVKKTPAFTTNSGIDLETK